MDYQTLKIIKTIDEVSTHNILMLQQREKSQDQFFVMVYKRVFLFWLNNEEVIQLAKFNFDTEEKINNKKIIQHNNNLYILTQINNEDRIYYSQILAHEQKFIQVQFKDLNDNVMQQLKIQNVISIDDEKIALVSGSKLIMINTQTNKKIYDTDYQQVITEVHYDKEMKTLYVGQNDGKIFINRMQKQVLIHVHYSKIISLTTFNNQLLSLQQNKNQFVQWFQSDNSQKHKNVQVGNEILLRLDAVGQQYIFLLTQNNSIVILDDQMQIIKQLNSLRPCSKHQFTKFDNNLLFINQGDGFINVLNTDNMSIDKFTPCDRTNIQAFGTIYQSEYVIDMSVANKLLFSLISFDDKVVSLNISTKDKKETIYSIYNVMLNAQQVCVQYLNSIYIIAVLSPVGVKIYQLDDNNQLLLKYLGFIRKENCIQCQWLKTQQRQLILLTQNKLQLIQINIDQNNIFQPIKQIQFLVGNSELIVTKENIKLYDSQSKSLYTFSYQLEQLEEQQLQNCIDIIYNGEDIFIYGNKTLSKLQNGQLVQLGDAKTILKECDPIRRIFYFKGDKDKYVALYATKKVFAKNTNQIQQYDGQQIRQQLLNNLTAENIEEKINNQELRRRIVFNNQANEVDNLTGEELLQRVYQLICQ